MRRYKALFVMLSLATLASPCPGAPPEAGNAPVSESADASRSRATEETDAQGVGNKYDVEQRYAAARELYAAGDLPGALRILKECHEVTRAPNLLFNIAQLYRELDECPNAVEYYQRYITESPDGARIADAKQYLDVLTAQCPPARTIELAPASGIQAPARAGSEPTSNSTRIPPPARVDSTASSFRYWDTLGWTALGVGALATAGSAYASIETMRAYSDTEDANSQGDFRRAEAYRDDWYRNRRWAFGLGVAAVVSVGFGVYVLVIAAPGERRPTHTVSTTFTPDSALLDYGWGF